jgi:hypothetical protein
MMLRSPLCRARRLAASTESTVNHAAVTLSAGTPGSPARAHRMERRRPLCTGRSVLREQTSPFGSAQDRFSIEAGVRQQSRRCVGEATVQTDRIGTEQSRDHPDHALVAEPVHVRPGRRTQAEGSRYDGYYSQ